MNDGKLESFKKYVKGKICNELRWDRLNGNFKNEIIIKLRTENP